MLLMYLVRSAWFQLNVVQYSVSIRWRMDGSLIIFLLLYTSTRFNVHRYSLVSCLFGQLLSRLLAWVCLDLLEYTVRTQIAYLYADAEDILGCLEWYLPWGLPSLLFVWQHYVTTCGTISCPEITSHH